MPAPVKGTMDEASAIMLPRCSTPLRRSGAITSKHPTFQSVFKPTMPSDLTQGWKPVRAKKTPQTKSP
jgi:hypothetical protein